MKFEEFNKEIENKLSIVRDEEFYDVYSYLKQFFSDYINEIKTDLISDILVLSGKKESEKFKTELKNELNDKIDSVSTKILCAFESYSNGNIIEAINNIYELITDDIQHSNYNYKPPFENEFYRIRIIDNKSGLIKANGMFHIPFEKRYLVSPQRFSINGFPCLYVGDSILVSWLEMGEPNLENFCVSRLELDKKEKEKDNILDLRWPSFSNLMQEIENVENPDYILELIKACLINWPLIIACSLKVQHPQAPFKPEYVIPQLVLMSMMRDESFIGCAYTSTKINSEFIWETKFTNFVFPAKKRNEKNKDYKLLKDYFLITDSICYKYEVLKSSFEHFDKDFTKDIKDYKYSTFGMMEQILKDKELKKIE